MRKIGCIVLFVFLLSGFSLSSQPVTNFLKGKRLNVLLNELVEKQNLSISFDDVAMSSIIVPKEQQFLTTSELFLYLKRQHYIKIDTLGSTFVLKLCKRKNYTFQGKVVDACTREPLPNAEIIFKNEHFYSSEQGYFTILSKERTPQKIQIRYLGYTILDTIIMAKGLAQIPLKSNTTKLENITIERELKSFNVNIGNHAGGLKLTPEFVQKIPGYGASSLYSFLKLMPGVLATGESGNDISLRGSYEGQNCYVFDECRVYQPWYRLTEIGTVNPLLIKDIEVYKSGGDATFGENIGGMVVMKGQRAIPQRTTGEFFANNFILNGKLEVPLNSKMAVIVAARKNLTEKIKIPDEVGEYTIKKTFENFADNYQMTINPNYKLYDGNLKFIYKIHDNSTLSFNALATYDQNTLNAKTFTEDFFLQNEQQRKNQQFATSLTYEHYNLEGKQLQITTSFSEIQNQQNGLAEVLKLSEKKSKTYEIANWRQSVLREFRAYAKWRTPFCKGGVLNYGVGFTSSYIKEIKDTKMDEWHTTSWHRLGYGFLNFQYAISEKWSTILGSRLNYSSTLKKLFFEPRLEVRYYPSDSWKFYGSYGIFQQFVYHANIIDPFKNVHYLRVNAQEKLPTYKLENWCLGGRYAKNSWTISSELFYKYIDNQLGVMTPQNFFNGQSVFTEKVRYLGGDLFVKFQQKGFISWLSFTLSDFKVQESDSKEFLPEVQKEMSFSNAFFSGDTYKRSNYDMRQEVKGAIAYSSQNFTVSATYIYGSGFQMWHQPSSVVKADYQRFDIGASYKFNLWGTSVEVGSSVLNILNRKNKKLDEFSRFGVNGDIVSYNTYGLKRTLAFFLKIKF